MPVTPPHLDPVIEPTARRLEPGRRELFARFAAQLLHGVEPHHAGGESALGSLALDAFEWVEQRPPGELRVRVRNPKDHPGHTVVEVLQEDHPFILDTLRLAVRRFEVQERVVIHPILGIERDAEGRLLDVRESAAGGPRESYVYIEFGPRVEDGPRLAELTRDLREVMGWVDDLTSDHRRMVRAMRELVANLEFAGPNVEGGRERAAKVQDFLDWIVDGRFVFVGMRRYRLDREDGEVEVQIIPGTGLGMWRQDASSRLHQAKRGADVPEEIRDDVEDPRIILISKSHMESRIHRHGRLDRIVVKEHDDRGSVTGFTIIVGLFTLRVLRTPGSEIPLLSERLREVIRRLGLTHGSHQHKAIVLAFDSAPVELLVGADVDQLADLLEELVEASGSKSVRLVTRTHPHGRALYAAVLLPREHYREDLRAEVRHLLEQRTGASYIDDRISFVEEGTAIVHCFCTSSEGHRIGPDLVALEEEVRSLCSPWENRLVAALRQRHGEGRALELAARYEAGFPEALRVRTHPQDAVRDIDALEALAATGEPQFALWFDRDDSERETTTLRMYLAKPPLLSDILPAADHFGIRVVDAQLATVTPAGRPEAVVESLRILPLGADQHDLDAIAPRLANALAATFAGTMPSDALNGLVLGAGLDWRQVDLIRAYLEYFVQIQGTLSRPYLRSVLLDNPLAVRVLVQFFEVRHDPSLPDDARAERGARLSATFQAYRDRITALNEDRALQGFMNLIEATLRTNFFSPRHSPHRIVLKLDPSLLKELSGIIPYREIFVHSAELAGVHLRGGPVARGGLRWSDRHDDLRVEILGLMSTQMLKNGLIVPVGAKGGFVLRRGGLSPSEARRKADEQYRVFIASLLDVTDNLAPDGAVIAPEGVRRLDDDDPYLVVAADKGTAHLSDLANEIAVERDFWLGDAFASGGSEGYDHKKYAITARGAWECVKHRFAELGIDPERDVYSVAGIGDMSGDVFGNGLQLMRRAKLLAAFDHRHVFLDPDPDPEISWQERQRLFELPRSSWADYSSGALSEGGGVWPRGSKRIRVPEALAERLGLSAGEASGQELVRAILAMDVDLLWNGGIGTYLKASHETHADAGDRANDAVRIDAGELRARVVGEGGNLGLTQAARVEASLRGVRLDTDAIDNSAGVDLSDHEVNYKVALAPLIRSGRLDAQQRRELLFDVADAACESVLAHNRSQALALSLDELRSRRDPEPFLRAIEVLCEYVQIEPAELDLPDAAILQGRAAQGVGLTRPELAVLLGLAKLHTQAELNGSTLAASDYLDPLFRSYFPARFCEKLADALSAHRLREQIGALCVANRLLDPGGATLFASLTTELGVGVAAAVAAMLLAEDLLRIPEYRRKLQGQIDGSRDGIYRALVEVDEGVRAVARYLVRCGETALDASRVETWRNGLDALRSAMRDFLSEGETQRLDTRRDRLERQGLPAGLAFDIAGLALADRGLNILRICERTPVQPPVVARVYARLGETTGINWVYDRLSQADATSLWDRMVIVDVRWELLDLQREITENVVAGKPDDLGGAVDEFLAAHAPVLERVQALQRRAAAGFTPNALVVISARLRGLRSVPSAG